jgi:hypothetical protein
MILYKFKSLTPRKEFERVTETLLEKRLYCPTPSELNDPIEGLLGATVPDSSNINDMNQYLQTARFWHKHQGLLNRHRLCSFSKEPDSMLMWTYYSGGHSGICIEVDMSEYSRRIKKVKYISDLSKIDTSSIEALLTQKLPAWRHEKEYRIILEKDSETKYIRAKFNKVLIAIGIDAKYISRVLRLCAAAAELPIEIASLDTTGEFRRVPMQNPYD